MVEQAPLEYIANYHDGLHIKNRNFPQIADFWLSRFRYVSGKSVLNLGCGPMFYDNFLHFGEIPEDYVGVDLNENTFRFLEKSEHPDLIRAKKLTEKANVNVTFHAQDIFKLADKYDATFDTILGIGFFATFSEEQLTNLLGICRKMLKPGGRLLKMTWHGPQRSDAETSDKLKYRYDNEQEPSPEQLVKTFEKTGFETISNEVLDCPPDTVMWDHIQVALFEKPVSGEKSNLATPRKVNPVGPPKFEFGENFRLVRDPIQADDYLRVRASGGLGKKYPPIVQECLNRSARTLQIHYKDECIGFCRLIGDGYFWHELLDLSLLEEHRSTGAGFYLTKLMIREFLEFAPPTSFLYALTWIPKFGIRAGMRELPAQYIPMSAWQPYKPGEEFEKHNPIEKPALDLGPGFEILHDMPDVDDYLNVRHQAGLNDKDIRFIDKSLETSLLAVQVRLNNQCLGFCRLVGDGGLWYIMVDLAVVPGPQKEAIKLFLQQNLLYRFYESAPPSAYLLTFSDDVKLSEQAGFDHVIPPEQGVYQTKNSVGEEGKIIL